MVSSTARGTAERAHSGVRCVAAQVLGKILRERQSLASILPAAQAKILERDRGLLQELCYGTLRWYPQLQFLLECLLDKPLKPGERELQAVLLIGLYQLLHLRIPPYAATAEAVATVRSLGKPWAAGLINAILRNFQRRRAVLLAQLARDEAACSAHPLWLLQRLKADWPQDWPAIVAANNARPPQGLRVNRARITRQDYLGRLASAGIKAAPVPYTAAGIILASACDVERLPGFAEGLVSVQDPAAQLAVDLLDLKPGMRVLDACAAPGGKTCHILESEPRLAQVLALDDDVQRLSRIYENLKRLGLKAQVVAGDALNPKAWWDGVPYERILLDTPCSASGVIRRHPDIKVLRKASDIERLAKRQYTLLARLWSLLAPGGRLIYATCSVLKQENEILIGDFLATRTEAWEWSPTLAWGHRRSHGRQILPGEAAMDGFYYACLVKDRNHSCR